MKKCIHKDKPIVEMSICKKCTEEKQTTHTHTHTQKQSEKYVNQKRKTFMQPYTHNGYTSTYHLLSHCI